MGDIGRPLRHVEFEPLTTDAPAPAEPEYTPAEETQQEEVPV